MIEESVLVTEELLLHDEDFPNNYIDMAHPDDYKTVSHFNPQFIFHTHYGRHNRLIARAAWKTPDKKLIPMSFVCDTGAPSHIYLSTKALSILDENKLLMKDERDTPYVKIHIDNDNTFPATVEETPSVHKKANILGLKSLQKLHIYVINDKFSFNKDFVYL
jgi:hypothetical protein